MTYACGDPTTPADDDASLTCAAGTSDGAGTTTYCCVAARAGCTVDASRTSCPSGAGGYACLGASRPTDADASLACDEGTLAENGAVTYCCAPLIPKDGCAADARVAPCTQPSTGYSCDGAATPAVALASLRCGPGFPGPDGDTSYCCRPVDATGSCRTDIDVTDCPAGAVGFSCTGSDAPTAAESYLSCGPGAAQADGTTRYCCSN